MNQKKYEAVLSDLRLFTTNDDTQLWIVIDYLCEAMGINPRKMTVAQGEAFWGGLTKIISMMLADGFVAGNFGSMYGRETWPEQEPDKVMARIKSKWIEYKGEFPNVGFIVWFALKKE